MQYKYYKNIKSSLDCLYLNLNPTKIEFELKKPNPSSTRVLKMIVQAHSNIGLVQV